MQWSCPVSNSVSHFIYIVAKLETTLETIAKGSKQGESKYKIHSIALNTSSGASSILSAHMQTMSLLHDHQDTVFDPTIACDVIEPALEVERADKDDLRNQRVEGNGAVNEPKSGASNGNKSKPKVVTKKATATGKKSTSAAAFFKTESEPKKKAKAADPKPADPKPVETKKKASATKKSSATKKTSIAKKAVVEEKKPDSPQKKKGSADDFVGDMDEDEDFLKEEEERKTRNAEKEKKHTRERKVKENTRQKTERRKPLPIAEGEDVEMDASDDGKEVVHGAMDDFASKKTVKRDSAKADDKGRKRRKQVLEEKTFVDESGFLRTETVSVWKEIEDGEDEKATTAKKSSSSAATAKPKNTKNMKQQGLMGFFGKK